MALLSKRAGPTLGLLFALLLLAGCSDSSTATQPSTGPHAGDATVHDHAGEHVEESAAAGVHSHDTPGETCFICDPGKREAGRLWCKEHDRYEDRCWDCHPDLEQKDRLYCEEHGLYEDECTLCGAGGDDDSTDEEAEDAGENARVAPSSRESSPALQCNEHRVPEELCGICQPQLAAKLDPGAEMQVRFESLQSAGKAGIATIPARASEAQESIQVLCEVAYNRNELARITPLAAGVVRRVLVDVGADVEAGDVLVEIHSADVAGAKSAFVSAVVDLHLKQIAWERERRLAEKKISSDKDLQEADAARRTAELTLGTTRQRLLNYGFTEEEVESISEQEDSSATLLVRAPYRGTVVERAAVVGEAVSPGDSMLGLANLDTMWLSLSIPADQARLAAVGIPIKAVFDGYPGLEVRGSISWINTAIDERTRLLRARAVVDNSSRALKSGMFGEARLLLSELGPAVTVPSSAIQRYEGRPYVFVKLEDDLYALRRVTLVDGGRTQDSVAVLAGLAPEEPVVTEGAFTAMSEFLKSRLGAGCTDD